MTRDEIMTALVAALRGIKTANGYQNDVQSVLTGRPSLVAIESLTGTERLPILTVNTRAERPEAERRSTLAAQSWTKDVVIQGYARATETWDDDLDRLADDLRRCLHRLRWPAKLAQWTEIQFFPPEPDSKLCVLQAQLSIVYVTTVT